MAHFAGINNDNTVLHVLVVPDEEEKNGDAFLKSLLAGMSQFSEVVTWLQTSYNTYHNQHSEKKKPFRGNYAGVGFTYDPVNDVFIPPKPFDSWILDETIWDWKAPIEIPDNENAYVWDEASQSWTSVD